MPDLLDEGFDVSLTLAMACRIWDWCRSGWAARSASCARRRLIWRSTACRKRRPISRATRACKWSRRCFRPTKWTFDGPNGEETIALGPATFQVNVAEAMAVAVTSGMGISTLIPIYSAISGLRKGDLAATCSTTPRRR